VWWGGVGGSPLRGWRGAGLGLASLLIQVFL